MKLDWFKPVNGQTYIIFLVNDFQKTVMYHSVPDTSNSKLFVECGGEGCTYCKNELMPFSSRVYAVSVFTRASTNLYLWNVPENLIIQFDNLFDLKKAATLTVRLNNGLIDIENTFLASSIVLGKAKMALYDCAPDLMSLLNGRLDTAGMSVDDEVEMYNIGEKYGGTISN